MFVYPEEGDTDGAQRPSIEPRVLRARRAQADRALGDITEDGFVFRVDMRLRPYGESGPLAVSFDALENYLVSQGREWERYAWIKARALTGARDRELDGDRAPVRVPQVPRLRHARRDAPPARRGAARGRAARPRRARQARAGRHPRDRVRRAGAAAGPRRARPGARGAADARGAARLGARAAAAPRPRRASWPRPTASCAGWSTGCSIWTTADPYPARGRRGPRAGRRDRAASAPGTRSLAALGAQRERSRATSRRCSPSRRTTAAAQLWQDDRGALAPGARRARLPRSRTAARRGSPRCARASATSTCPDSRRRVRRAGAGARRRGRRDRRPRRHARARPGADRGDRAPRRLSGAAGRAPGGARARRAHRRGLELGGGVRRAATRCCSTSCSTTAALLYAPPDWPAFAAQLARRCWRAQDGDTERQMDVLRRSTRRRCSACWRRTSPACSRSSASPTTFRRSPT